MPLHEFYEFLGRLAELLIPGNVPLSKKLESVLGPLFAMMYKDLTVPNFEGDISSESDCDDDWVEDAKREVLA